MEKLSQFGQEYITKRLRAGQSLEVIKRNLENRMLVTREQLKKSLAFLPTREKYITQFPAQADLHRKKLINAKQNIVQMTVGIMQREEMQRFLQGVNNVKEIYFYKESGDSR